MSVQRGKPSPYVGEESPVSESETAKALLERLEGRARVIGDKSIVIARFVGAVIPDTPKARETTGDDNLRQRLETLDILLFQTDVLVGFILDALGAEF